MDAVLSSIIGRGGMAALLRRSLHLARAEYPWLPGLHASALDPFDFSELQAALASQPAPVAATADRALTRIFHDLLASLIGSPLAERLLRPPPASRSDVDPIQDTSP